MCSLNLTNVACVLGFVGEDCGLLGNMTRAPKMEDMDSDQVHWTPTILFWWRAMVGLGMGCISEATKSISLASVTISRTCLSIA